MKIYIMRHGQTNWNVLKKIQGQKDIPLNEIGIKQAEEAKETFNSLHIDLLICSPLKRASQTAEIINSNRNLDIIYNESLIERYLGDLEGQDSDQEDADLYNYNINTNCKNVEPVVDLCNRIYNFLDNIKINFKNRTILLVTHSGTARAIEAYFYGISENGNLPPEDLKNCEIREYEFKD